VVMKTNGRHTALHLAVITLLITAAVSACAAVHPVLEEAQRLARAGASEQAVTEYKRYLFFNPDSPAVDVCRAMAKIYRSRGDYTRAQEALSQALTFADKGSDTLLRDEIRLQSSVIGIAQGKFAETQADLMRVAAFSNIPAMRERARLFLCIAHLFAGEWDKAEAVCSTTDDLRLHRIDSLLKLAKKEHGRHCSPVAAQWMSTFVPGLGQAYAHDLPDGLNALAVSALTGFLTVNSLVSGYYKEAVFTDIFLFWRYYSGNRWNAFRAAERYNAQKDRVIRRKIMAEISDRER